MLPFFLGGFWQHGPSAWSKLQSGSGWALHPVILDIELPGASDASLPGHAGEACISGRHCYLTHAWLIPEAPTKTSQTILWYLICSSFSWHWKEKESHMWPAYNLNIVLDKLYDSVVFSGFSTSKINKLSDWSNSYSESSGGHGHSSTLPRMFSLSCRNSGWVFFSISQITTPFASLWRDVLHFLLAFMKQECHDCLSAGLLDW